MSHVWVIEKEQKNKWILFTCCETRSDARYKKRFYERMFPTFKFRVKKYIREDRLGNIINDILLWIFK